MTEIDEKTLRDQLKVKRNSLQQEFQMNPSNTRLALEIRLIDDLIASVSKYLEMQKAPKTDGPWSEHPIGFDSHRLERR